MSDFPTLEQQVLNFRDLDKKKLQLDVGSRDGYVYIGLRDEENDVYLRGVVEPTAARQIVDALNGAIRDAKAS